MKEQFEEASFTTSLADYEDQNLLLQNLIQAETPGDYEISSNLETADPNSVDFFGNLEMFQYWKDENEYVLEDTDEDFKEVAKTAEQSYLSALDSLHASKKEDGSVYVKPPTEIDELLVNRSLRTNKGTGKKDVANKKLKTLEEGLSETEQKKIDKKESKSVNKNPWLKTQTDSSGNPLEVDTAKLNDGSITGDLEKFSNEYYERLIKEKTFQEKIDSINKSMPEDSFVEWKDKQDAKLSTVLDAAADGMDTATAAIDMATTVFKMSEKLGFMPAVSGTLGSISSALGSASNEIAKTLRMDTKELAFKRFEMSDQQRNLVGPGYTTGVVYPGFVNNQVGDIVRGMEAFMNKFVCFFTITNKETYEPELYKIDFSNDIGQYPYYYYMDEIKVKPVKKATTELRYGAFKTQVALTKPEGRKEFEFTMANDISLIFWSHIRKYGLGVHDGTDYTSYGTTLGGLAGAGKAGADLQILIPTRGEPGEDPVVSRLVLKNIRFASMQDLGFSHKEGQLKSKIKGICNRILWFPNTTV